MTEATIERLRLGIRVSEVSVRANTRVLAEASSRP